MEVDIEEDHAPITEKSVESIDKEWFNQAISTVKRPEMSLVVH